MKRQRTAEIHFYEWSVSRWKTSTTRLLLDGTGRSIYRELLDSCYAQGGFLNPDKDETFKLALVRDCAVTVDQFDAAWKVIRRHFIAHQNDPNMLAHKAANLIRREYFDYVERQRSNGKAGGEEKSRRASGDKSDTYVASAEHMLENIPSNGKASAEASPSLTTTITATATAIKEKPLPRREVLFEENFWPIVWNKTDKKAARESWCKKATTQELADKIIMAAKLQGPVIVANAQRHNSTPIYVSTWLNRERYNDDPLEFQSKAPPSLFMRDEDDPNWIPRYQGGK